MNKLFVIIVSAIFIGGCAPKNMKVCYVDGNIYKEIAMSAPFIDSDLPPDASYIKAQTYIYERTYSIPEGRLRRDRLYDKDGYIDRQISYGEDGNIIEDTKNGEEVPAPPVKFTKPKYPYKYIKIPDVSVMQCYLDGKIISWDVTLITPDVENGTDATLSPFTRSEYSVEYDLLLSKTYYKNNIKDRTLFYESSGAVIAEYIYHKVNEDNIGCYFPEGKTVPVCTNKDGILRTYDYDGNITSEKLFVNGEVVSDKVSGTE